VVAAVVDMKRRNPTWECPRIAQQIALAFGIPVNKDVVQRILAVRYQPGPESDWPSWLTVLGQAKDSSISSRYYNGHRTHAGLDGRTPEPSTEPRCERANVSSYRWQLHCRGLYQTPMAA